jgi:hypothetical protein
VWVIEWPSVYRQTLKLLVRLKPLELAHELRAWPERALQR